MMLRGAILGLALAFSAGAASAQRDFSEVDIKTTHLADGVFMLEGAGGNIGLSTGKDGAFLIDDQFAPLSARIMAAIREETDADVAFVLNTHFHGDHTGGNADFAAAGAYVVAHENVRKRLKKEIADGEASPAKLPIVTFSDRITFYWNDQIISITHPLPAHTDGDAAILFKPANVLHAGDLLFNGRYPYIDLDNGGDLDGYIAAQEKLAAMIDDETRIIPGHGPAADKADLLRANAMLKQVRARVQALIDDGLDEEAVVNAAPLADLDKEWAWEFISSESMTRTAYRSLTRGQ